MTQAIDDIAAERRRQISHEGWTPEHDDEHTDGDLALAACCYAAPVLLYGKRDEFVNQTIFEDPWPWDQGFDKRYAYGTCRTNPGNVLPEPASYTHEERRDLLVKAGALILAEIERLDRQAASRRGA